MSDAATVYVGIDDTDTLDTPGTNQLARHLVRELAPDVRGRLILRHQLLEDPRVPCTKKNGCASIEFLLPLPSGEGRGEGALGEGRGEGALGEGTGEGASNYVTKPLLPADILKFARDLRKNQTDAETLIWSLIRDRRLGGFKFRRQYPVEPYILDFYCHDRQLAIELDGGQHNTSQGRQHDEKRAQYLASHGIRVVRYWNHEVLQDMDAVLEAIWIALHAAPSCKAPSPNPLPKGEGFSIAELAARLRDLILDWIPPRSDPGLAIAATIPVEIADWGERAKRELLTQKEAHGLAASHGIYLEGLAGTQDGIIGALAALGLMSTRNDGRVVYLSSHEHDDALDITGSLDVATIRARGIDTVIDHDTNEPIHTSTIAVGKKLRPNLRDGRITLYASRNADGAYEAVRVT